MKRSGFTMIELIFVIVILGLLAAVAIPKLAATRDDAKVSKILTELSTLKNDMSAYYSAQGTYVASAITDETNVHLYTATTCIDSVLATSIASGSTYYYCIEKTGNTAKEPLVSITPTDVEGAIAYADQTVTGNVGTAVQGTSAYDELIADIQNGGSRVSY